MTLPTSEQSSREQEAFEREWQRIDAGFFSKDGPVKEAAWQIWQAARSTLSGQTAEIGWNAGNTAAPGDFSEEIAALPAQTVPEGWPDALNLAPMPQSADPSAEIEAVQRDAWISVEHEMPKPYTDVLIAISTGKVLLASYFSQAGWDWAETDDAADMDAVVTHWMPLPPAPIAAAPLPEPTSKGVDWGKSLFTCATEPLTDEQIDAWAIEEQFVLFADPEDVRDIVRTALQKWALSSQQRETQEAAEHADLIRRIDEWQKAQGPTGAMVHHILMAQCRAALSAPQEAGKVEAVATLHDDGCFTWRKDEYRRQYDRQHAGWRMDVYAHPSPQASSDAKDAARYRWLRIADAQQMRTIAGSYGAELDDEIDAAILAAAGGSEK